MLEISEAGDDAAEMIKARYLCKYHVSSITTKFLRSLFVCIVGKRCMQWLQRYLGYNDIQINIPSPSRDLIPLNRNKSKVQIPVDAAFHLG